MNKRILSLVLVLTLVLGSFSFAFADTGLTAAQKIEELKRLGFVKGNETGDLMLDKNIDRASTAVIVAKALEAGDGKTEEQIEASIKKSDYQGKFPDVKTSHWANAYINNAVERGIVKGTDKGTFLPDQDITYAEVITMMVQVLGLDVDKNVSWPENYIGAARKAGILDGINSNYRANADREGVFVLLYNTVTTNKVGNYQIDKVLVLENNRVESIGKNELVVEVIKEVQRANFVGDSRSNKDTGRGEQLRITLPSSVGDAEDLLGKVVDLSYDKDNNAVRVQEDKTYQVKVGKIELEEKSLVVGDNTYTVLKDDRYKGNDERIFSTYINNQAFTYEKAYDKFYDKDSKKAALDFGRVTIKNGKVLFVDAFKFDDIAPVKEVKKDGAEVIVYNDINDGGEKRIELDKEKIVSVNKDGKFSIIDKADIEKLDVIHVGTDTKDNKAVVVRQDAKVNGTYEKVVEKKSGVFVVVDEKEYKILTNKAKQPVYAYDSKEFRKLEARDASSDLKEFKNEKSTVLLDVNGDLQYLGSEIKFGEFVSLVDRIVGKEARVLKVDDTKTDYTTTLDSKLGDKSTGHQSLQSYDKGDLVFIAADKENIDTMKLFSKYDEAGKEVKSIDKDLKYIDLDGTEYRVLDRTNVFVRTLDSKGNVDKMYATTLKNIEKNAKDEILAGKVKAVVKTDEQYNNLDPRRTFDKGTLGAKKIANTIIFTEVTLKSDLDTEIAEITHITNRYEEIDVKFADGTKKTYKVEKDSKAYDALKGNVVVGDIVELGITKNDDKLVKEITTLIEKNASGQKITSYNERTREVEIGGKTYYTTRDTANFVKNGLEEGIFVAIHPDGPDRDYIKAVAEKKASNSTDSKGKITYINAGKTSFEVDGIIVNINTTTVLKENGRTIAIGLEVGDKLAVGDKVSVKDNVITRDVEQTPPPAGDSDTITKADVETKVDMPGMLAIKVKFPAKVSNVKVIKVGSYELTTNNSLTDNLFKNFPGDEGDEITFTFNVEGKTETQTVVIK